MFILFVSFQCIGILSDLDFLKHSLGNRLGNLIRSKSIPAHAAHQLHVARGTLTQLIGYLGYAPLQNLNKICDLRYILGQY